jgi:hypothetical protein
MIDDFNSRWGDGTDINKYTLGTNITNKGYPCGYTKGPVLYWELFLPVSLKGRGGEKGEKHVGGKVQGRIPRKNTVQSSITSMGFPLLQKPGEMCVDRQIGVSGKFWNFNRGHTSVAETTTFFKCTVFGFHVLHKSEVTEAAESEVTEPDEFHVVSDEIRRWSSHESFRRRMSAPFVSAEDGILNEFEMMWQLRILFPLHFVVFKQTVCHLTAETNVEQVFSRAGQFSEVNLDRGFLTDMVSIMVNKLG